MVSETRSHLEIGQANPKGLSGEQCKAAPFGMCQQRRVEELLTQLSDTLLKS